jgi:hypothetical protein
MRRRPRKTRRSPGRRTPRLRGRNRGRWQGRQGRSDRRQTHRPSHRSGREAEQGRLKPSSLPRTRGRGETQRAGKVEKAHVCPFVVPPSTLPRRRICENAGSGLVPNRLTMTATVTDHEGSFPIVARYRRRYRSPRRSLSRAMSVLPIGPCCHQHAYGDLPDSRPFASIRGFLIAPRNRRDAEVGEGRRVLGRWICDGRRLRRDIGYWMLDIGWDDSPCGPV